MFVCFKQNILFCISLFYLIPWGVAFLKKMYFPKIVFWFKEKCFFAKTICNTIFLPSWPAANKCWKLWLWRGCICLFPLKLNHFSPFLSFWNPWFYWPSKTVGNDSSHFNSQEIGLSGKANSCVSASRS